MIHKCDLRSIFYCLKQYVNEALLILLSKNNQYKNTVIIDDSTNIISLFEYSEAFVYFLQKALNIYCNNF